jgi:hypothetical protein
MKNNAGFGLIKNICERADNKTGIFQGALKYLSNLSNKEVADFLAQEGCNDVVLKTRAQRQELIIAPTSGLETLMHHSYSMVKYRYK